MSDKAYATLLFFTAIAVSITLTLLLSYNQQSDVREGCAANNVLRGVLYDFLVSADNARRRDGDVGVANEYRSFHERLNAAAAGKRDRPDRPEIDCASLYGALPFGAR